MGLFDKLKGALQKTKDVLRTDVRDLFKQGVILDEAKLEEFTKGLITTDMGVSAANQISQDLRETDRPGNLPGCFMCRTSGIGHRDLARHGDEASAYPWKTSG